MALPMVITSTANEGIGARADEHILIADDPAAFAAAVVGLLRDRERALALGRRAHRFIIENWPWQKHFDELETELVRLAADSPASAAVASCRV